MAKTAATGEQYEITFGDKRAAIVEVGATLREFGDVAGPIVDGYGPDVAIAGGRGQVLMPWPNRIRNGQWKLSGTVQQLPITEAGKNNASHGLLRWVNWRMIERTSASVSLGYELHPQPGYPFAFTALVTYEVSAHGLEVRMKTTNIGGKRCPMGIGAHPFFTAGPPTVDEMALRAPVGSYLPTDDQLIPAREVPVTKEFDYGELKSLEGIELNMCFGRLARDHIGRANIDLLRADDHKGVRVWMDDAFKYVQLFTGDTDPVEERRRRSVAIEPMTCAPDAFNNDLGLKWLDPGESLTATWGANRI